MTEWKSLSQTGVVLLNTIGDGNCFFHAIIQGILPIYNEGYARKSDSPLDKREFINSFRRDLAENLSKKKPNSTTSWYDYLSRGELKSMSKEIPSFNLDNMKSMLDSNQPVDNLFHEYVSEFLGVDVYILDVVKKDVYITGDDSDILHKNRKSVVIGYTPGHYSTIGLSSEGHLKTSFEPTHPFIISIREKLKSKRKLDTTKEN